MSCVAWTTAWQARRDHLLAKVNWQFTTQKARIKLKPPLFDHFLTTRY